MEKNKYFIIYKTTNLKNGKFYVGMHVTTKLDDGYLGSGKVLKNSVYYHGKENFKREIIEFCEDKESLSKREREIVNETLLSDQKCMNLIHGGVGGNGFKDEEHKKKFFEAAKISSKERGNENLINLLKTSETFRTKFSNTMKNAMLEFHKNHDNSFKNKKHSEETKEKMKLSAKNKHSGKNNSQYGTMWITNGKINKKINNEKPLPKGFKKGRSLIEKKIIPYSDME